MQKGRRKKVRYIQKMPKTVQFSPRGKPGRPDEIELRIDQFEALRLADLEGFEQIDGAKAMGISRPTFGRVLREGRKIIVDALVNGKIIRIRMGDAQIGVRQLNNISSPNRLVETGQHLEESSRNGILKYGK